MNTDPATSQLQPASVATGHRIFEGPEFVKSGKIVNVQLIKLGRNATEETDCLKHQYLTTKPSQYSLVNPCHCR